MSVQLLDKTRKINKLLHNNNSSKVVFNDICEVLTGILDSNILVISKKGKVLGSSVCKGVDELQELIVDEVGGFIDPALNERLLVLEAALLIEEHYDEICDELWYINTSRENRRARLKESRGYSDAKVDQIFASQLSEEEYERHCKVVIDNNGLPEQTFAQIDEALRREAYE